MNKSAIALAADSKVTVSSGGMSKTYDTVSKVFTLSKIHPVGIMIFGNAEFMGYPWETIIKTYRKKKGAKSENTLKLWAEDFKKYVIDFGSFSAKDKAENARDIAVTWVHEILSESRQIARERRIELTSSEYVELLKARIDEQSQAFIEAGSYFGENRVKGMSRSLTRLVYPSVLDILDKFNDDDLVQKAASMAVMSLISNEMSPHQSGLVIAGFGEDDFFPGVYEYSTDGYVGKSVRIIQKDETLITVENNSCIRSFAQGDMVQRFMNGIDQEFREVLEETFQKTLTEATLGVLDKYGTARNKIPKIRNQISDAVNASAEKLNTAIDKFVRRTFSLPIIHMVALLPKDELANLAESLVALTSLKRRVSSDVETVGGAVDVALISKGDGFVWIKRKHYFPSELNDTFGRNYMRGINQEEVR